MTKQYQTIFYEVLHNTIQKKTINLTITITTKNILSSCNLQYTILECGANFGHQNYFFGHTILSTVTVFAVSPDFRVLQIMWG